MKNTFIFIAVLLNVNVLLSQNIKIELTNKIIRPTQWCFNLNATAQATYTGAEDNWTTFNVRYDVQLPMGVDFNYDGEVISLLPAGITIAVSNPGGTIPSPYTDDFSLNVTRDETVNPDLVIGMQTLIGQVCIPTIGTALGSLNYDQREPATSIGSFYVNPDDALTRRPFTADGAQLLPIKMQKFTATPFEGISAKLEWITATEINASHFEVERSVDGITWSNIGKVAAAGESNKELTYSYTDKNVGLSRTNPTYYYRLNMVDKDGSAEYSEIRSVTFDVNKLNVELFPNPVQNVLKIDISSPYADSEVNIEVFDQAGKLMATRKTYANALVELDMTTYPSGIHMVKVNSIDGSNTYKVIKIN